MRAAAFALLALVFAAHSASQTLAPAPASQHITVVGGVSADAVAAGGAVSLWVDVTPKPNIHVYAPGAKDFSTVALIVSPQRGLVFGKPVYPAGELMASAPGADDKVPVYRKLFRITQPLTIAKTAIPGQALTIAGAVNYQACDDRVCFLPTSAPVSWTVRVR